MDMNKKSISFNSLGSSGQVGNQLFQFAALVNLANKNDLDILLPDPKAVEGKYFYNYFVINEGGFQVNFGNSEFANLNDSNNGFIKFDKKLLNITENSNLNGYFQSLKYINLDRSKIRNAFRFKAEYVNASKKILGSLDTKNNYFIHARRGDYLHKKDYHYPLSKTYYKRAIKKFKNSTNFLIFSDDLDWCKSQRIFKKDNIFFIDKQVKKHSLGLDLDIVELCLMSMCSGGIIANSSYSWWGAWLQDETGNIIMPDKEHWFGRKYIFNADELIENHWTTVKDSYFHNLKYKIFGI
jgi:hypothetical protein